MTIDLTNEITRPALKKVRVTGFLINVSDRRAEIQVSFGYFDGSEFVAVKMQPIQIQNTEAGALYDDFIKKVPEIRVLCPALEAWVTHRGFVQGTTT